MVAITNSTTKIILLAIAVTLVLAACGGGGGGSGAPAATTTPPTTSTSHTVTISWTANRESAVNTTGGGYTVAISGQSAINVPYVSGAAAPTSVNTTLSTGSYTATVTAYSTLNPPGGTSGSKSAASTLVNITVP